MIVRMATAAPQRSRIRAEIDDGHKWNLTDIYPDWETWDTARSELEQKISQYAALKGTLHQGPERLLAAYNLNDSLGQLAYKVYFYPSLKYDEDQRDNSVNARKQQIQALVARWQQATSWFSPELLTIPLETVRGWLETAPELAVYRFAIEEVYRQQEHVLDEHGEKLLSLSTRLSGAPHEAYLALSTADAKFPEVTLSTGEKVTMSYGQYRAVLATNRNPGRSPAGVPGPLRHVRREPEHLRDALSRRLPARLVLRALASLQDDARRRAARQQHSALGRRHADRDDARGRRAASPVPSAAPARAEARALLPLRFFDPDHRMGPPLPLRRRPRRRSSRRSRRSDPNIRRGCGAGSANAGSTSTKTTASAAARIRRRCTACIRTCCSTGRTRSTTCSRWRTRWATRCTRCCRTSGSRSSIRTTRSSSPKCRRR